MGEAGGCVARPEPVTGTGPWLSSIVALPVRRAFMAGMLGDTRSVALTCTQGLWHALRKSRTHMPDDTLNPDPATSAMRRLFEEVQPPPTGTGDSGGVMSDPEATVLMERRGPLMQGFEQDGDRIGRYHLLEPLGEGGFGTVWLAEQVEPVKRSVALKIIKLGMDTREVIARFEQERQALAMMDHENIARVLDAGATDAGRPFFVMELVKGVPITKFCDAQRLGLRQRLELFSSVCSAINHAHQKGIIHRDIKPSNVLVTQNGDGAPLVKVIDFGIAKATQGKLTDRTLLTSQEQIIGTPAYMSPEQAALTGLDVDTRSDIYSLGVLLYELLAGRPPFDPKTLISAGYHEMCRIIVEVEPPKPSTCLSALGAEDAIAMRDTRQAEPSRLAREVRGDLDWIVMKAIEKDRARRYETANDFAMDLRRFLASEPVLASPPSAAYRFRKFARRNKAALLVAAMFAVVLITATIVSVWQAKVAIAAKQEALVREAKEREAREEAQAVTEFVTGVFKSADPARNGRTITVAETLDRAVKQLDAAKTLDSVRRISLTSTLGSAYKDLGLNREAIPLLERVREHYLRTSGLESLKTTHAMYTLAQAYDDAGRAPEALRLREEVLAQRRKIFGSDHNLDTISAMGALAGSYFKANRMSEAIKLNTEALAVARICIGPEHNETLNIMRNLGAGYALAERWDEAVKLLEPALETIRKLRGVKHPAAIASLHNLAACYAQMGRAGKAVALHEELVALNREVYGPEHLSTMSSIGNLALCYATAGRRDEAAKTLEELLPLLRKVHGTGHPGTTRFGIQLARLYSESDRYLEARKLMEEMLPAARKNPGPAHPVTLEGMQILGYALARTGSLEDSAKLLEELLVLQQKVDGPEHKYTLGVMNKLAMVLSLTGRLPEAITVLEKALVSVRRVLPASDPDRSIYLLNLAQLYETAGRMEDAAKLRGEAARAPAK